MRSKVIDQSSPTSLTSSNGPWRLLDLGVSNYRGRLTAETWKAVLNAGEDLLPWTMEQTDYRQNITTLRACQQWYHGAKSAGQPPEWVKDAELTLGISSTELLAIVCMMMLEACPISPIPTVYVGSVFIFNIKQQFARYASGRASQGARILSEFPDRKLIREFCNTSTVLQKLFSERATADAQSRQELLRDYIRLYVEDSLLVILPDKPPFTLEEELQRVSPLVSVAELGDEATRVLSLALSTMTSSLGSKDFAEFRSLTNQIKVDLEDSFSRLSLEPLPK
ncbi:hypothetical protein B0J13DRAFT_532243 [Dactylonectria estremocensis]|uniref:Uncharacterized protein n=1 Tax=Dactylonectria estremocensis TaxID=1079267 RepID=A0A9P9DJ00_9HYPO|nr:hypothetical protein B0J13DRAFT_532243 [Dactylonectria estremocensis]